jgi:hypothetical protein
MQTKFDAPELTQVGQAVEVVMGVFTGGDDVPNLAAWDFEFAQDQ